MNKNKNNNITEPQISSSKDIDKCIIKKNIAFGRSGPLIGIIPIVLSSLNTTIKCELHYKYPIVNIKTLKNKLSINEFKLIRNNEYIFISGYILKTVVVISKKSSKKTTLNLPFHSTIKIKYSTYPQIINNDLTSSIYKTTSKNKLLSNAFFNINCDITSANITEKTLELENKKSKLLLNSINLNILITQNQNVFIPEPCGDVTIIEEFGTGDRYNPKFIEIGISDDNQLIGKIFK